MIGNRKHTRLLRVLAKKAMTEMELIEVLNCRPSDIRVSLAEVTADKYVVKNDDVYEISELGIELLDIIAGNLDVVDGRMPAGAGFRRCFGRAGRMFHPGMQMRRGRRGFAGRRLR